MPKIKNPIVFKKTLIDKAIEYISPQRAKIRYRDRMQIMVAEAHTGATYQRKSLQGWVASQGDSDTDDLPDICTLRGRSRDLYRNNNFGRGAIITNDVNVISTGLRLHSIVDREYLNMSDEEADKWENDAEREFRLWSESKDCDARRMLNFYEMQSLAFISTLISGDCVILFPLIERLNNPYRLALQLIEADQIANPLTVMDGSKINQGIEVNSYGEPIRYYIRKTHPGNIYNINLDTWNVRPYGLKTGRRNLIHLLTIERPGQRRGIPYLSPVIESLKQLGRYTEAELMAAVVAGMFTTYITTQTPGDYLGLSNPTNPELYAGDISMGNGAAVELGPNQSIQTANPSRPNAQFDSFAVSILRQVGSGLGIPFEVLIRHFQSSYSASRAALLEAWKFFKNKRVWVADNFCKPIYEEFLYEAVLEGRLRAPGFLEDIMIRKAYGGSEWISSGMGQIDPVKETKAANLRVGAGYSTRTAEAQMINGSSFENNARILAKEKKLLESLGVDTSEEEEIGQNIEKDEEMPIDE